MKYEVYEESGSDNYRPEVCWHAFSRKMVRYCPYLEAYVLINGYGFEDMDELRWELKQREARN